MRLRYTILTISADRAPTPAHRVLILLLLVLAVTVVIDTTVDLALDLVPNLSAKKVALSRLLDLPKHQNTLAPIEIGLDLQSRPSINAPKVGPYLRHVHPNHQKKLSLDLRQNQPKIDALKVGQRLRLKIPNSLEPNHRSGTVLKLIRKHVNLTGTQLRLVIAKKV